MAHRASAACGNTEEDRIVWARERMFPAATMAQVRNLYQWLVNATHSCSQSGDLWFYRGLTARQLARQGDAEASRDVAYSLQKADDNNSKARASGFDPFTVVSHAAERQGPPREKWALIVGIATLEKADEYLEFSVRDAREFGDYLSQFAKFKKENVKVLVEQEATTVKIREAFGEIRNRAKPDDLVLIFISSHGRPREFDPTGLSYVLTYDTDASTQARLFATSLQMVELAELGRWVQARDYVLLLDTCFSGAAQAGVSGKLVPQGSDGLDPLQGLQGAGNRAVISASRADEKSYEDLQSKHGFFTRFLLEALRKDGKPMELGSVFDYLRDRVSREAAKPGGREQHPVMQAFGAGKSIVLGAPPLAAFQRWQFDPAVTAAGYYKLKMGPGPGKRY